MCAVCSVCVDSRTAGYALQLYCSLKAPRLTSRVVVSHRVLILVCCACGEHGRAIRASEGVCVECVNGNGSGSGFRVRDGGTRGAGAPCETVHDRRREQRRNTDS